MKLKDFKPKYEVLEFLPSRRTDGNDAFYTVMLRKLIEYAKAVEDYGECEVLSVKDYDRTRTTSVIVYVGRPSRKGQICI